MRRLTCSAIGILICRSRDGARTGLVEFWSRRGGEEERRRGGEEGGVVSMEDARVAMLHTSFPSNMHRMLTNLSLRLYHYSTW